MIMCSYKKIVVTSAKLSPLPLPEQIQKQAKLHKPDIVIVREKELEASEYEKLAVQVMKVCRQEGIQCILHSHLEVAAKLKAKQIHLPLWLLRRQQEKCRIFEMVGVSVHSRQEAEEAYKLGADYLIAGHIFPTACKAGLPGRGLDFLQEICCSVPIPVYGIGGIDDTNTELVRAAGALGECRMSYYMQ